jgi:hypothetical protein
MEKKTFLIAATGIFAILLVIIIGTLFANGLTVFSKNEEKLIVLVPSDIPAPSITPTPSLPPTTEPFHVAGVSVSVDQPIINGSCPAVFTFTATVSANDAGTVSYRWVKSDGTGSSTPQTITFDGAGEQTVSTTWNLGSTGFSLTDGWEKIQILSPNTLESNQALITLHCS